MLRLGLYQTNWSTECIGEDQVLYLDLHDLLNRYQILSGAFLNKHTIQLPSINSSLLLRC